MTPEQREIQLWNDAVRMCQGAFAEAVYDAEREAGDGLANPARQFIGAVAKLYRSGDARNVVTGINISAFPDPDNVRIMTKQFSAALVSHAKSQGKDVSE